MNKETQKYETATVAGGCFWCLQPSFDQAKGVISTRVGYTGGQQPHPTYEEVCTGRTGHFEAIEIKFDPTQISYSEVLDVFWRNINPTQTDGQFSDIGPQYQTAIFYRSDEQKKIAEESKRKLGESGMFDRPIATEIIPAKEFYAAEDYHQQYYVKCPLRYKTYKYGSGRQSFIEKKWGSLTK